MRVTVGLCNGSFVRWCNGFCPRLITRMFRDRACVRRRLPLPIIRAPDQHSSIRRPERHVRYRQSSSQSIGDARKGHCLFLAEFDHDSRVLLEPDTAKMLGLCDDLFRSRGRPKALCAVRLGVRGAKRCAGQLGGRARVQRGGDLSPTYLLGAALRMHAAIPKKALSSSDASSVRAHRAALGRSRLTHSLSRSPSPVRALSARLVLASRC